MSSMYKSDDLGRNRLRQANGNVHYANVSNGLRPHDDGAQTEEPPPGQGPPPYSTVGRARWPSRKSEVYRSTNSLDLDTSDVEAPGETKPRHYGSTSSLDVLGQSSDSFFALLEGYRPSREQRSAAPPQLLAMLQSQEAPRASPELDLNGTLPSTLQREDDVDGKTKRSKTTPDSLNILRRLRSGGNKTNDDTSSVGSRTDYGRGRLIAYYDCQSVGFNLSALARVGATGLRRRNTTTGASAAALARSGPENDNPNSPDTGDGNSNELLLSCPYFRNEVGGESVREVAVTRRVARLRREGRSNTLQNSGAMRPPRCCAVSVIDPSLSPHGQTDAVLTPHKGFYVEHTDLGVYYYRKFFYGLDHQNYFGLDDRFGPIAISIKREKLIEKAEKEAKPEASSDSTSGAGKSANVHAYQYRIIIRTSELSTLRCAVREDAVPCSSRPTPAKGLPHRDLIEYLAPELQQAALKLGTVGKNTQDQLLQVDEAGISKCYKAGVLLCREGQGTEEEMYCNERSTPAFDEFLALLGQRVRLKGFQHYRAQLDNKSDSTGTHSVYSTLGDIQLMFHVSTLLPYTANNKQQLLRKRHIGNDIVTVVFQEPGAKPFTPRTVRSHFQHVFIVVRVQNPCTEHVRYSVSVSRSREVPHFGPPIPEGATFQKTSEFSNFMLAKIVNAENAVHKSEKFVAMATRTRQEYLKDLAANYVTSTTLDSNSRLGRFGLGSVKRKDRHRKTPSSTLILIKGGCVWEVQTDEQGRGKSLLDCWLVISAEAVVVMDKGSKEVIFTCSTDHVLGWVRLQLNMRLYYGYGEMLIFHADPDDLPDIEHRLLQVTEGCPAVTQDLRRDGVGQLGLQLSASGVILSVEPGSAAAQQGLRPAARLLEASKQLVFGLNAQGIREVLSGNEPIPVVILPPTEDGKPRKPSLLPLVETSRGAEPSRASEPVGPTRAPAEAFHSSTPRLNTDLNLSNTRPASRQNAAPPPPTSPPAALGMGALPWRGRSYTPSPAPNQPPEPLPRQPALPERRAPALDGSSDSLNRSERSADRSGVGGRHTPQSSHVSQNSWSDTLSSHSSSGGGTVPRHSSMHLPRTGREDRPAQGQPTASAETTPSLTSRSTSGSSRSSSVHSTPRRPQPTSGARATPTRPVSSYPTPRAATHPLTLSKSTDFQDDLMKLINLDVPESSLQQPAPRNSETKPVVASHDLLPARPVDRQVKAVFSSPPDIGLTSRARGGTPVQGRGASPALPERTPAEPDTAPIPSNDAERVRELEARVRQLEAQVAAERRERTNLESQVTSLRQENQRLLEESQTAAAQLRRFTEWFFNSVDGKQ